jgi:putative restriction endonuclease
MDVAGQNTLSLAHVDALKWFSDRSGQKVPWSELNTGEPKRAIIPKGIYRPAGWRHTLSIKIIPAGRYPDEEPALVGDRLRFRYHQEEPKGMRAADYFTNLGLQNCMLDGVPVGVIRQIKPKPGPIYEVLGLGRVVDWSNGFFTIDLLDGSVADQDRAERGGSAADLEALAPVSLEDARQRIAQAIVRRRGQAKFRSKLLKSYGGRCAISGCAVSAVLEAAHIKPYLGTHTNVVQNGLLLRADLHTLFDLKLLRIEPVSRRVSIAAGLRGTEYAAYEGRELAFPTDQSDRPAHDCLEYAWSEATLLIEQ